MVFFVIFCAILGAKVKFSESLTIIPDFCAQFYALRMFIVGWLHVKVNPKIFKKSIKK